MIHTQLCDWETRQFLLDKLCVACRIFFSALLIFVLILCFIVLKNSSSYVFLITFVDMQKQEYLYKAPNHTANLNEMRLKDKWCDVTIKVNQREIRAHKLILAANLKYFDTMLSNDSFQESNEGVVDMKSVEAAELEAFITYAYTGEILLTDSNALNLLELANYLSEDGIKIACIEFLEKNLGAKEACRAYKIADSINCQLLKNIAKATIVKNFEDCSQNTDYFAFNHESLMEILSDSKAQPIRSQQMFFKGIMRWILQDAKNRNVHIQDLLSSIDITVFATDDLVGYLYEKVVDHKDEHGILRDTIFYHQATKIEKKKHEQALLLVGQTSAELSFQSYNFTEKKWSSLSKIPIDAGTIRSNSAVLNDKLYYISTKLGENHLQEFNPTTHQITTLNSSNILLELSAICACDRFLYLCGGEVESWTPSDQVLKYDPQANYLESLPPMGKKRSYAAATFHESCLYVFGGLDGLGSRTNSVEKYDPNTKMWTNLPPMGIARHFFAVASLNGKLYACGEFPSDKSTEFYEPSKNRWQSVACMNRGRHSFSVIAYEGKLLAVGGENEMSFEVYDPSKNQWQIDDQLSSGLEITNPVGGLISASCIIDKL